MQDFVQSVSLPSHPFRCELLSPLEAPGYRGVRVKEANCQLLSPAHRCCGSPCNIFLNWGKCLIHFMERGWTVLGPGASRAETEDSETSARASRECCAD